MSNVVSRRSFLRTVSLTGGLAVGSALLVACGGGGAEPTKAAPAAGPVTLEIASKGDELKYDKDTLEAPAGSKVTVKLKNNASVPTTIHNWVLAKSGQGDAVAADGIAAGESNDYLKDKGVGDARIIAHIPMTKGGATGEVTFDAPAAGAYDYICTFPGHNVTMKGKFTVK